MTNETIAEYYDNFLEHLKVDHLRENPRHTKIKANLKAIVKPGMTVLDIGCGTGITSKYMAELGAMVTAVDISPKNFAFASEHSVHKNVTYICQDVTTLDLEIEFDLIVIADCFEHIHPGRIGGFQKVISDHSNDRCQVYLNIPDGRFQVFMKTNHPDKLQIIDESYHISDLLIYFDEIGFDAMSIVIYGLDFPMPQYVSMHFVRAKALYENYRVAMG